MRRIWIAVGLLATVVTVASATMYQRGSHWKEFHFTGSRLMADLAHPDAYIRTSSLSKLPRDLLRVPIAHDVLTEDLAFYYEQNEDRLGLSGAIKRIAYEHNLDWSDRILAHALHEPAEVALWRDGKGALRNYAIIMHRNMWTKVLQEAATVALQDSQLKRADDIDTKHGKAQVLALQLNPRRTLLLISQGEKLVVLSDPGLFFDSSNKVVPEAREAISQWLTSNGTLAHQFALDSTGQASPAMPAHTFVIGAPTLTLGYSAFMPGFKGLRFDFGTRWSTSLWLDRAGIPAAGLGDAGLWHAAPANPSACVVLPVDWHALQKLLNEADNKPHLPDPGGLAALAGSALTCWYSESSLYSPVFIVRMHKTLPHRDAELQALANWAIASGGAAEHGTAHQQKAMIWRDKNKQAAMGAQGAFVVFSPDGALVNKVLDTIVRAYPSVADQIPTSNLSLALLTPRPLSAMVEHEVMAALSDAGDANLLAAAQTHLPARMQALSTYPAYRLELNNSHNVASGWQRVEWRTTGSVK